MTSRLIYTAACLLPLISTASNAALVISDPYYDAPGLTESSSFAGSPAQLGEAVITYVNFDDTAYDSLYYAFGDSGPHGTWDTFLTAGPSMYAGTSAPADQAIKNPLAYNSTDSSLGSGLVVWSGNTTTSLFGNVTNLATRFTMEVADTSGSALSLTDASSLGLDSSLGGVLDVTGDFQVTLNALLVNNTGSSFTYNNGWGVVTCNVGDWCNAIPVWDRLNGKAPDARLHTSYDSAFYSSPVPVPAAVWLFGSGLIGLVGLARRKQA